MTEIILVRHGEASASWQESTDPGLSELGERQAEECANLLFNINGINKYELVSSPLKRAIETGSKLEEKLKGNLNINSSFAEIPSPGISLEDRQAWLREIFNKKISDLKKPQAEWRKNIIEKIWQIENPTVIFSHFMVINTIVGYVKKDESMVCFYPDNCSITKLNKTENEIHLTNLGSELSSKIN